MATLGDCSICQNNKAKYKCSKCPVQYCSIPCFKSPDHKHEAAEVEGNNTDKEVSTTPIQPNDTKYSHIFNDKKIKYMLGFKSLQVHLSAIYTILKDPTKTKDQKTDLANAKLINLRATGSQENELVEEFCQCVHTLLHSAQA